MLTIIGCGNLNRSDDGVGVVVAQRLLLRMAMEADPSPRVRVYDAGTAGAEVMFMARGSDKLVLVDACRSGSEPGAIFRVPGADLAADYTPTFSLHDFRWDHAIHAGRKIFGNSFPRDVTVFLIEAKDIQLGLELSEPVRRAAGQVVAEIAVLVESYVGAAVH
jgi:hydrogenase maturation protease